jgi:type I restriction enzyme S subunit
MTEWREVRLGDACARLRSGSNITAADIQETGDFPVFGGNGIRGYSSESNFSGECAIIGRQGAYCGNVRFFRGTARMSEHAIVACANSQNNTQYLAYLLSTLNLGRLSGQAAQPGLSVKVLAQQLLLLPPLETQMRIASVVDVIDDLIANNRRRVEVLEEIVRATYREWFVKFRYPGHEDIPLVDSALGLIPEGWRSTTLDEVAVLSWGDTKTTKASYVDKGFPTFSAAGRDGYLPHADHLSDGVVISAIGAQCGKSWYARGQWSCIKNTMWMRGRSDFTTRFLFHATAVSGYWPRRGAAQPFIALGDAKNAPVLMPCDEQIRQFDATAGALDNEVAVLEREADCLATIRHLLLPKLVTGQIDVSSLDLNAVVGEKIA